MSETRQSTQFDPYYTWLGIPPDQQPANHYRLLGLQQFESDPDVIDIAANRQVAYLRQVAIGERRATAIELTNRINHARSVLIHPKSKLAYDELLRSQQAKADAKGENRNTSANQPSLPKVVLDAEPSPGRARGTKRNSPSKMRPEFKLQGWQVALASSVTLATALAGIYWTSVGGKASSDQSTRPPINVSASQELERAFSQSIQRSNDPTKNHKPAGKKPAENKSKRKEPAGNQPASDPTTMPEKRLGSPVRTNQ